MRGGFEVFASSGKDLRVPIFVRLISSLDAFIIEPDFEEEEVVFVVIDFYRTTVTKVFSVFAFLLMWILSILFFFMAVATWTRNLHHEIGEILSVGSGFLFALPAVRVTQPNIPSVGVLIDVVGFIWNMVLIAFGGKPFLYTFYAHLGSDCLDRSLFENHKETTSSR